MTEGDTPETPAASTRNLTRNEVLVIRSILAGSLDREEDRIRACGIPRSTYHLAKARIYANGILEDRYVPSPQAVGAHSVSLLLTRPFTDARDSSVDALCKIEGTVLVWSGIQSILGVVFHPSERDANEFRELTGAGEKLGKTVSHVEVPSNQFGFPVYFDYEGAWNHFAGLEGSMQYPRALPHYSPGKADTFQGSARQRSKIDSVLRRPFDEGIWRRPSHLLGPTTLARSQFRMVESGIVEWRTFLCVKNLPTLDGQAVTNISIVSGQLNHGESLLELFQDLTEVCGVYPFLLASDGRNTIVGILAGSPNVNTAASDLRRPRSAVFPVVSRHLSGIEVVREPVSNLIVHRDHRYDLLASHAR
jgi:hypothetical protein